jgi:hypothetical protein
MYGIVFPFNYIFYFFIPLTKIFPLFAGKLIAHKELAYPK